MKPNPAAAVAESLFPRLCRAVVVHPDSLRVDVKHGCASSVVCATLPTGEAGDLIGKKGARIRAFSLLAKLVGDKHGWPVAFTVSLPVGYNPPSANRPPLVPTGEWNAEECESLLADTLAAFLCCSPTISKQVFEHQTVFEVVLDDAEPKRRVDLRVDAPPRVGEECVAGDSLRVTGDLAIQFALCVLFGAVGRLRGRCVQVAVVRRGAAAEPQPATAAGRYAGVTP